MYRLFIAICLSILPTFIFAQIDSFDIAGYARPDLRRSTAMIQPYFRFNSNTGANKFSDVNKSFRLQLGGAFSKTDFINTDSTQISAWYSGGAELHFSKNNGVNIGSDATKRFFNFSPWFSVNFQKKSFKLNQQFFEISFRGNIGIDVLNIENNNFEEISRALVNGYGSASFSLGKGRIEIVNDAWHALTILEMLDAANLLIKPMNQDDIKELADKIATIKNYRNTDNRLELISEYEALCGYFLENEIVDRDDYRFFAHLNDAWLYESFITRQSGKEWKYGISPRLDIESLNDCGFLFNYNNIGSEPAHLYEGNLLATISYNHYQAASLDWQKNFLFQMSVGPSLYKSVGDDAYDFYNDWMNWNANLETQYTVNYIPNARTYYQLSLLGSYQYTITGGSNFNNDKFGNLNVGIRGNYIKYISPQISWYVDGRMTFNSRQFEAIGHTNFSYIQAGINYRLY